MIESTETELYNTVWYFVPCNHPIWHVKIMKKFPNFFLMKMIVLFYFWGDLDFSNTNPLFLFLISNNFFKLKSISILSKQLRSALESQSHLEQSGSITLTSSFFMWTDRYHHLPHTCLTRTLSILTNNDCELLLRFREMATM